MQEVNSAMESLSLAVIHVLDRSKHLNGKDQYALINEFAEWIVDLPSYEEAEQEDRTFGGTLAV